MFSAFVQSYGDTTWYGKRMRNGKIAEEGSADAGSYFQAICHLQFVESPGYQPLWNLNYCQDLWARLKEIGVKKSNAKRVEEDFLDNLW